jgi:hypothetical protein
MVEDWEKDAVVPESWEDENEKTCESDSREDKRPTREIPVPPTLHPPIAKELETKEERDYAVKVSDLHNAMDLFGIKDVPIDQTLPPPPPPPKGATQRREEFAFGDPSTLPEFESLAKRVASHLSSRYSSSKHYPLFLEALIRHLMAEREVPELRKLSSILGELASTKSKARKKPTLSAGPKKGGTVFEDMLEYSGNVDYEE